MMWEIFIYAAIIITCSTYAWMGLVYAYQAIELRKDDISEGRDLITSRQAVIVLFFMWPMMLLCVVVSRLLLSSKIALLVEMGDYQMVNLDHMFSVPNPYLEEAEDRFFI